MKYEENYNFCFPNQSLWKELIDAQAAGDGHAIGNVIAAQVQEIGKDVRLGPDGKPSIATDPDIMLVPSFDFESQAPAQDSHEDYQKELELLMALADYRGAALETIQGAKGLPDSLTHISYFLRDYKVKKRKPGQFFGDSEQEHNWLYSGKNPKRKLEFEGETTIKTGDDFCTLVMDDNPLVIASLVVQQLEAAGVERRNCPGMEDRPGITRFASGGVPFIIGGCGEVLRRVGIISFIEKWLKMQSRPAQDILFILNDFLKSAYPWLHPTHPSRNAMHFIAYAALVGYLKFIYNPFFRLPNGNTVGFELDLLRDNLGDGRMWPGVHTRLDHQPYQARAEKVGITIAKQHLAFDWNRTRFSSAA